MYCLSVRENQTHVAVRRWMVSVLENGSRNSLLPFSIYYCLYSEFGLLFYWKNLLILRVGDNNFNSVVIELTK